MSKIVICPDSFKGSLRASEVAGIIADTISSYHPEIDICLIPLADGGEGTAEVISNQNYPIVRELTALNPIGEKINTRYFIDLSGEKAFIESADIIGLPLISPGKRNVLKSSSFGLGELIKDAVKNNCKDITVALGGSATSDGGMGMLQALGYRFFDSFGQELAGNAENLVDIAKFECGKLGSELRDCSFTILCDVNNPLLGEKGAARVFSPQKGANGKQVKIIETGLSNLVNILGKIGMGNYTHSLPGAGAAGGLGYTFMEVLGAKRISGIDFIFNSLNLEKEIKDAQLIITGEGRIDRQSLMGKVLSGVIQISKKYNIPVVAFGGQVRDKEELKIEGLYISYEISDPNKSVEENMEPSIARTNLKNAIMKFMNEWCLS